MKPLQGIKIVEFATYVVVPIAARVLSDWGAEVIKIEAAAGDDWRRNGYVFNLPCDDDSNPLYAVSNSGKDMISLNLKTPEGKEALFKMLADADIFMTNIRYAGIERLGLSWEILHEKFPSLIYFHFNGFGYEGPWKDRPGFDTAGFWAMSGALAEFGEKGSKPMYTPPAFGDISTSGMALGGIMAALYHRERTGEGLRLTTSLLASGIWCNHPRIIGLQDRTDGKESYVTWPAHPHELRNPFSNIYECKDGRMMLFAAGWESAFAKFMPAAGLGEYLTDPRFATALDTGMNATALYHLIAGAFLTKTCDEWDRILTDLDLVHQELMASRDIPNMEQAWVNGYQTHLNCPNGDHFVVPNSPVTFFGIDNPPTQHVGGVGCDTSKVLARYGYSEEQIRAMLESGAAAGK